MSPAKPPRDDRDTRASLAFYFALILLAGQVVGNFAGVPFNYLLLSLTGAIILGVLFGPTTMIDFFRAIRGNGDERHRGSEDEQ